MTLQAHMQLIEKVDYIVRGKLSACGSVWKGLGACSPRKIWTFRPSEMVSEHFLGEDACVDGGASLNQAHRKRQLLLPLWSLLLRYYSINACSNNHFMGIM